MTATPFAWLLALTAAQAGDVVTQVPDAPKDAKTYLIYLHGRIIENAGPRPTDARFGLYDYPAVLEALASRGAVVISAQRAPGTDMNAYAGVVVAQIESLIERGVSPSHIVVVGFSKGGGIATRVSSFARRADVRFVLLAACPEGKPPSQLEFTGQVLSVVEESDTPAGSCKSLADQSSQLKSFKELKISTGKLHGAFYQPRPEWVSPVLDWIHREPSEQDVQ